MMNHILCYVDLSPLSLQGARMACAIAEQQGAAVELAHATDLVSLAGPAAGEFVAAPREISEDVLRRHTESLHRELEAFATTLRKDTTVDLACVVIMGRSVESMAEHASAARADLIVVAAEEPGLLEKLLHRSVSERLARRATTPVLVYARETDCQAPFKHLLVATDYSAQARVSALVAANLVGRDGKLSFLHVWQPPHMTIHSGRDQPEPQEIEPLRETQLARLRRWVVSLALPTLEIDLLEDCGQPEDYILRRAKELCVDAIVLGSHRHDGLEERVFGSLTDSILKAADRPVIAVPTAANAPSEAQIEALPTSAQEMSQTDTTLKETFPASDPPSWWAGRDVRSELNK